MPPGGSTPSTAGATGTVTACRSGARTAPQRSPTAPPPRSCTSTTRTPRSRPVSTSADDPRAAHGGRRARPGLSPGRAGGRAHRHAGRRRAAPSCRATTANSHRITGWRLQRDQRQIDLRDSLTGIGTPCRRVGVEATFTDTAAGDPRRRSRVRRPLSRADGRCDRWRPAASRRSTSSTSSCYLRGRRARPRCRRRGRSGVAGPGGRLADLRLVRREASRRPAGSTSTATPATRPTAASRRRPAHDAGDQPDRRSRSSSTHRATRSSRSTRRPTAAGPCRRRPAVPAGETRPVRRCRPERCACLDRVASGQQPGVGVPSRSARLVNITITQPRRQRQLGRPGPRLDAERDEWLGRPDRHRPAVRARVAQSVVPAGADSGGAARGGRGCPAQGADGRLEGAALGQGRGGGDRLPRHRLAGATVARRSAATERHASFGKLPPGSYTVTVTATSDAGRRSARLGGRPDRTPVAGRAARRRRSLPRRWWRPPSPSTPATPALVVLRQADGQLRDALDRLPYRGVAAEQRELGVQADLAGCSPWSSPRPRAPGRAARRSGPGGVTRSSSGSAVSRQRRTSAC